MNWFKGIEFAQPNFSGCSFVCPADGGLLLLAKPATAGYPWPVAYQRVFRHRGDGCAYAALWYSAEFHCADCPGNRLGKAAIALSWQNETTEGIDIMIATDISGSMLSEDFKPNRLEAGKNIAIDFIKNRPNDLIGLVVFSGESFTQCPLTIDHDVLINLFHDIKNGMIDDGTAIGMGLATAVNRLKDSEAKSKVIILLTDGVNNMGSIPPITAAEIAKQFGVQGLYGWYWAPTALRPILSSDQFGQYQYQMIPVEIDEATLGKIASITGGKYFRARNNTELSEYISSR